MNSKKRRKKKISWKVAPKKLRLRDVYQRVTMERCSCVCECVKRDSDCVCVRRIKSLCSHFEHTRVCMRTRIEYEDEIWFGFVYLLHCCLLLMLLLFTYLCSSRESNSSHILIYFGRFLQRKKKQFKLEKFILFLLHEHLGMEWTTKQKVHL